MMTDLNILIFIVIETGLLRWISKDWNLLTNFSSIQIRTIGYIFLRWIPLQKAHQFVTLSFILYCLGLSRQSVIDKKNSLSAPSIEKFLIINKDSKRAVVDQVKGEEDEGEGEGEGEGEAEEHEQREEDDDDDDNQSNSTSTEKQELIPSTKKSKKKSHSKKPPSNLSSSPKPSITIKKSRQSSNKNNNKHPRASKIENQNGFFLFKLMKSLIGLRTDSRPLNSLKFLINLMIALFCLDFTFRTLIFYDLDDQLSFSRIGAVGESWAKIHVRIPPPIQKLKPKDQNQRQEEGGEVVDSARSNELIGAKVIYRPLQPIGNWITGPDLVTSDLKDWNALGRLEQLWPGTTYEYRLMTLNSTYVHHPLFPAVGHFKTAPDSRLTSIDQVDRGSFSFAYTSCIKPGFPYNPIRDPLHNDGAEQLADYSIENKLDFVLFLGDFIYADSPFYPGHSIKHYHRKYRQSFFGKGWKKLIQSTRVLHIYDDHEILNDWAGKDKEESKIFKSANLAYKNYLGDYNYDGPGKGENFYWFRYGDSAFFVWDCRRYRSKNEDKDDESKTMLGENQKRIFLDWLEAVNSTVTFKFVVSSTPFMTLWSGLDGAIDTWSGFLTERSQLLEVMQYVPNLIILSGDRHEFAVASIRETIIEFSTSPLNQFWLPIKTLSEENGLGSVEGEDKLIKYIPRGNQKFSSLKVDSSDSERPNIKFEVFIDGKLNWNLTYLGKPIKPKPKRSLGDSLVINWESLLKLLKPIKWFR